MTGRVVVVRGGGDLATGVAHRLVRARFTVWLAELPQPLCVRRAVAFAEAVYSDVVEVEGVRARRVPDAARAEAVAAAGEVPVLVDAEGAHWRAVGPSVVVDGRLAKRPLDTQLTDAPLVIGLGPGFVAGRECHAVVETNRGHNLGRVYWQGGAEADTGLPEPVQGVASPRVLRAPHAGVFRGRRQIGDLVQAGEVVGEVDEAPITALVAGVVRGLLHDGVPVPAGLKVGDIDPRGVRAHCFLISDKARAVGGGVLEAILAGQP